MKLHIEKRLQKRNTFMNWSIEVPKFWTILDPDHAIDEKMDK